MRKVLMNQTGAAMLVAMVVLVMLAFIGIAAVTTSLTDSDISHNYQKKTEAFYTAEAGLEYGLKTMQNNVTILDSAQLMNMINASNTLGRGTFTVTMGNDLPVRTLISSGRNTDATSAQAVDVQYKLNPLSVWNNVLFAGVGQSGKAINGNVGFHGSVHIQGNGDRFTDTNGNGIHDPLEPYTDDNGDGVYTAPLTSSDVALDIGGGAGVYNNYNGMPVSLSSRVPALGQVPFGGENVSSLDAEFRVQHGLVTINSNASQIGEPDVSGGSPPVKETMDGVYVNDGFGGSNPTNVYADNGTSEKYDLGGGQLSFPNLNDPYTDGGVTYANYTAYLLAHALVIGSDLILEAGTAMAKITGPNGSSIELDDQGHLNISGIVYVTGNITIQQGKGGSGNNPIIYDGRGTLAARNDISITNNLLSKGAFPTDDVIGLVAGHDMTIAGSGASHLELTGAFFAQHQMNNSKQNELAGAMVSNYFNITNVPHFYQVPSLKDNLPPGMPGAGTVTTYTWKKRFASWREL